MNPHPALCLLQAGLDDLPTRPGAHASLHIATACVLLLKLTHAQKSDEFLALVLQRAHQSSSLRALRHNSMTQRRPRMTRRLAAVLVLVASNALRQPPRRIAAEKTLRVLIADVGGCVGIKFQAPPGHRRDVLSR